MDGSTFFVDWVLLGLSQSGRKIINEYENKKTILDCDVYLLHGGDCGLRRQQEDGLFGESLLRLHIDR
jgi:hypothetical protein